MTTQLNGTPYRKILTISSEGAITYKSKLFTLPERVQYFRRSPKYLPTPLALHAISLHSDFVAKKIEEWRNSKLQQDKLTFGRQVSRREKVDHLIMTIDRHILTPVLSLVENGVHLKSLNQFKPVLTDT